MNFGVVRNQVFQFNCLINELLPPVWARAAAPSLRSNSWALINMKGKVHTTSAKLNC